MLFGGGSVGGGLMPDIVNVNTGSTICLLRDVKLGTHVANVNGIGSRDVPTNGALHGKRAVRLQLGWRYGEGGVGLRGVVGKVAIGRVVNSTSRRVSKVGVSSHLVRPNRVFITMGKARASKRACVRGTVRGKTHAIMYRGLPRALVRGIACVGIGSARSIIKGLTAAFCKSPASGLRLINIANAGKGAAVTALLCGVFHGFKCGAKLVSAMYGCVSRRTVPASRAAPSPVALGGLLKHVTSRKYGCTFVRMDSRSMTRGQVNNLGFTNNVFAGLAHSRLSCRGAMRGCLGTGGTFFSNLPGATFTLAGLSSGGKLIVARGAGTGMRACSLHDLDSFGKGILRSKFRKVLLSVGGIRIGMRFVKHFGTSGLLTICKTTYLLKGGARRMLLTLDALHPITKHFSSLHSPGKCATVISCTRAPSTLRGILGTVRRILGNGNRMVAMMNTNNGHSGNGHPLVTRRTMGRDSGIVVASSGPHFRRPRRVVGSVLTKLAGRSVHGIVDVTSHGRTVHATYVLTRTGSIVLITKGKRRGCRRVGNVGRRFSSGRMLESVFTGRWAGRGVLCCLFRCLRGFSFPKTNVFNCISFHSLVTVVLSLLVSTVFNRCFVGLLGHGRVARARHSTSVSPFGIGGINIPAVKNVVVVITVLVPYLLLKGLRGVCVVLVLVAAV